VTLHDPATPQSCRRLKEEGQHHRALQLLAAPSGCLRSTEPPTGRAVTLARNANSRTSQVHQEAVSAESADGSSQRSSDFILAQFRVDVWAATHRKTKNEYNGSRRSEFRPMKGDHHEDCD